MRKIIIGLLAVACGQELVANAGSFVWPSTGVAEIPAGVTANIAEDDVAKIAGLDKIEFLGETSKVTYKLAAAWTLNVPVEGPGTFAFESAGDITISSDNRNLTGCFYFTNTTVLVTHENGLGSTNAKKCHFWHGTVTKQMPYGHTLDFDNGKDVFTNRVAVYMHALSTKNICFGSMSLAKTLVQDADFDFGMYEQKVGGTNKYVIMCPMFKNNVTFLRNFQYNAQEYHNYPYFQGTAGGSIQYLGSLTNVYSGIWFVESGNYYYACPSFKLVPWQNANPNYAVRPDARITFGAPNLLADCRVSNQSQGTVEFDLNGFDQCSTKLFVYGASGRTTGNPLFQITSATPAAWRITGNDSLDINPTFSGAAGFTKAGTGTYTLNDGASETTGELKVEAGTLKLTNNYKWGGTNVTVTGGNLVLDSARAVSGLEQVHLNVSGGTFAVKSGAAALVGYATFCTTNLPDGTYTMAQLKALPEVAPYIGAEADADAELVVKGFDPRKQLIEALLPGEVIAETVSGTVAADASGSILVSGGGSTVFSISGVPADEAVQFAMPVALSGSATLSLTLDGADTPVCIRTAADGAGVIRFPASAPYRWHLVVSGSGTALLGQMSVELPDLPTDVFHLAGYHRDATIVTSSSDRASTRLAAEELATYVTRMTGRELPVGVSDAGGRRVVIGLAEDIADLPEAGRAALAATDNREASWIGTDGTTLWIAGKSEVAELYATYHFLESRLGVRWFKGATDDDPGDYVETCSDIAVPVFTEFRQPDFAIRRLDKNSSKVSVIARSGETTAVRLGFQVRPVAEPDGQPEEYQAFYRARYPRILESVGGGHMTFVSAIPPGTYAASHPEYFAEANGYRAIGGKHYCLADPSVRSLVVADVIKRIDAHGGGNFHFGMYDDAKGLCTCAACRGMDPSQDPMYPKYGGGPNVSTRFLTAVNEMAAGVWEQRPDADLSVWAYQTYRKPPVGVVPDPRLSVQYCPHGRCYGHALDDLNCPHNVELCDWLRAWARLTPNLFTYEYEMSADDVCYRCMETIIGRDLRLYHKLGVCGWKSEAFFTGAEFVNVDVAEAADRFPSNWQYLYVLSRLLWDASADVDAILEDVERKYYGAAYPAMRKYQTLRRRLWQENQSCTGYGTYSTRCPYVLDALGAEGELLGYLDEAEQLAVGDDVRLARIALDRRFLNDYWITPHTSRNADGSINAFRRTSRIAVDGVADEGAWAGGASKRLSVTPQTDVVTLFDDEALYFYVTALEPDGLADGDGVEIWFDPPIPGGVQRTRLFLGADGSANLPGVTCAVRAVDGRWTLEARVPASSVWSVREGDVWRVLVRRTRNGVTLPDADPQTLASYTPLEIGVDKSSNASFRQPVDPAAAQVKAKEWSFDGTQSTLVPVGGGYELSLVDRVRKNLLYANLGQSSALREVEYTVRAHGTGKIQFDRLRYTDLYSETGVATRQGLKTEEVAVFDLTESSQTFRGTWVIPATNWNALSFTRPSHDTGTAFIETAYVRNLSNVRKTLAAALADDGSSASLEVIEKDDSVPKHGEERQILVEGYSGSAGELPDADERVVGALHKRLALDVPEGLVARPVVRSDGSIAVRYAEAPEYHSDGDSSPLCVQQSDTGTTTIALDVAHAVFGFWYTLISANAPEGKFTPCGESVQATGTEFTLESSPTSEQVQFYKVRVDATQPNQ